MLWLCQYSLLANSQHSFSIPVKLIRPFSQSFSSKVSGKEK